MLLRKNTISMAEEGQYYQDDSLGVDIEPEMDSSMVEGVIEFEPVGVPPHPTPTRHGEYEKLELLGEVYHIASGGDASTMRQDSSILKQFKSPMENTVLHVAALHGNDEMVDRVAQQDPDLIFAFNINHDTPLHVAARAGHISTLRKLLDHACANSDVTRFLNLIKELNNQRNIMLHEAMMSGGSMGSMIFDVLEAYGTSVEARLMANVKDIRSWSQFCYELALNNVNNEGQSVLCMAVEARLMEAVNRILEKCPESAMPKGIPPLVSAIMKRDKDMLTTIVGKKQEWIHLRDMKGRLPLHCAASIGYHEGVAYLLDICKTCIIQKDKDGYLPLHLAAHGGHVEVVKELLGYCPDPNEMLDPYLNNVLHIAARSGKLDVVRYILETPELEKMINQKNKFGETPLHVATICCHPKIVHALTWDDRVDLNVVNTRKQTPLDIAVTNYAFPTQNPTLRQSLAWVALKSAGAKAPHSVKITPSNVSGSDRFKDRVESLSVISTLIVTASVAACLAVPGEAEGTAYNLHQAMFHFFIFCITISLFTSISATIILIWGRFGVIELSDFAITLATPLLGAALITLSLAFLAGIYTVISKLTWLAATFVSISVIFVAIIFVLYILLFFPSSSTKKTSRYISYYPFIFLASLAEKQPEERRTTMISVARAR